MEFKWARVECLFRCYMPLLYLCICFVMTKMIVGGWENVCIAEYTSMYPYNGSLQVKSTLVKQKVESLGSHSVL